MKVILQLIMKILLLDALTKYDLKNFNFFDFDNVRILENERNYNIRTILEMIYIKKDNNFEGNKTVLKDLPNVYFNIIN